MQIGLTAGPAEVVAEHTVTTFFGHDLAFEILFSSVQIRVEIAFLDDATREPRVVDSAVLQRGHRFVFVNFEGSDGRGSAKPVLLADLGEDLAFLHMRVLRYCPGGDHTVHCCFYRVTKEAIGWTPLVDPRTEG